MQNVTYCEDDISYRHRFCVQDNPNKAKLRNVDNTCTPQRRSVKVTHLEIFICFVFSCEAYSGSGQIAAFGTSLWIPPKGNVPMYMDYTCICIRVSDPDADSIRSVDPDPGGPK
jgi:hypothetical protein